MNKRRFTFNLIQFFLLLIFSTTLQADSLEKLLMPGEVISAHEKYEDSCDQCHDTGSKERQAQLCVACHDHENILDDLTNKTGFHGQLSTKAKEDCKHCHTEHIGRGADIVLLNTSTFDHHKTDFPLKGGHIKTQCKSCHKPDKKYSGAPSQCYSCHKESDIHDGKQGKKCESCHSPVNWKQNSFDHDKTDFPLKNTHKETACASCHINQKYKDTPKECSSCHQINDVHRGDFGNKCDTCHTSKKWDQIVFDHNKKTDFSLDGKHKQTDCTSCHRSGDLKPDHKSPTSLKSKLSTTCYSCHKNDDSHKSRNGKKCADCHTTSSWQKQKFNHDKKTDFPLLGKHKKASCNQCHKGNIYKDKVKTDCYGCHKNDDAHKGKQGKKCDSCHNEQDWHSGISFDHGLARFPLIGMHAVTQCDECHLTTEYRSTEKDCNSCHVDDDVHKARLGTDCETCHTPNSWLIWKFDHDKATNFEIDGAHDELGCYDCHKTKSIGKLEASKDCISCHRSKDVHNQQFGRQCGECHNTDSFKDVDMRIRR